jgi:hypothetical protein
MKVFTITVLSLAAIAIAIFFFTNRKKKETAVEVHQPDEHYGITGQMVVDSLETLGYFKFTDSVNLTALKKDISETYDQYKILTTINAEKPPHDPYCRRFYFCDHETLFEAGGVVEYLKEVKPTFDQLRIPLKWSNDYFSDDATEHTIVVNGKKYIAFKGNPHDGQVWAWAARNFVEMLNDQLQLHGSGERVYLIMGGNDGRIVFLTKKQYDFINRHFDQKEAPKEVTLWWESIAGI